MRTDLSMSPAVTQAFVLGSGGFLGRRIVIEDGDRYIPFQVSQLRHESDLPRFEREVEILLKHEPEIAIVNCIGIRDAPLATMELLNVRIPESLTKMTAKHGSRLIHFGSAAETTQVTKVQSNGAGSLPPAMLTYGATKRAGTQACLAYKNATVLRVYNLYGLPHQSGSGLHHLCRSVRVALNEGVQPSLIDTTRDYVHWESVRLALDSALDLKSCGLIEVCSGFGISMSEIIEGLPFTVRTQVAEQLKPANYFAPVIGPHSGLSVEASSKSVVIDTLRDEVMTCASS